jgi:hypothetical protein
LKNRKENSIVKEWIDEYIGLTDRFGKLMKRLDEREFPEQSESEIL